MYVEDDEESVVIRHQETPDGSNYDKMILRQHDHHEKLKEIQEMKNSDKLKKYGIIVSCTVGPVSVLGTALLFA